MKRSDGFYNKKSYVKMNNTGSSYGSQIGWPAVGLMLGIILIFEYLVPYDLFGSGFTQLGDPRSELGGGMYTVDSPNIQTRLHAVNEIGIIMARENSYQEARAKLEIDQNRSFKAISQLTTTVNQSLNHKRNDGKTQLEHGFDVALQTTGSAEEFAKDYKH